MFYSCHENNKKTVKSIRPVFYSSGQIRIRLKAGEEKTPYIELGLIDCEEVIIDHTKIEANANRHKITWRKTVEKQLEKYEIEIDQLFKYINELNLKEDQESDIESKEVKEWKENELNKAIQDINNQLKEKQITKDKRAELAFIPRGISSKLFFSF